MIKVQLPGNGKFLAYNQHLLGILDCFETLIGYDEGCNEKANIWAC